MSTEQNKAVMQRIWKELLNEGGLEKSAELIAENYVYHGPGGREIRGVDGFNRFMTWFHKRFAGIRFTVDDLIAEGDKVVSLFTMEATSQNNKTVKFQGIIICRIVDGKEVEVWEVYDRLSIVSQLATGLPKVMVRLIEKKMSKQQP